MSLAQEDLRALDALRSRLSQLVETLNTAHRDLMTYNPLPTWPQMESLQNSLAFTLGQLSETMTMHSQFFKEAHVYPHSTFPGHTKEELLFALLRKKLHPTAEEWMVDFTKDGYYGDRGDHVRQDEGSLKREDMEGLWSWASGASQGIVGPMLENEDFADDFTLAEREEGVERVRTGLKRKLWEDESGDEDGGQGQEMTEEVTSEKTVEEGIDPNARPLPLEGILRFMSTGALPAKPNR